MSYLRVSLDRVIFNILKKLNNFFKIYKNILAKLLIKEIFRSKIQFMLFR